ncbi:hypothetical protein HS088_TW04G01509 [Tripterygium wilfordii]|uniref:Uncharacterized protein n=1 Tax=Tripterygium wilfordii TaxID=458696 RepID=A0A7J7DT53_TRIWF|nr:hypothetical protein HS088_TW04G01509 [Tripterygium wilfordii]
MRRMISRSLKSQKQATLIANHSASNCCHCNPISLRSVLYPKQHIQAKRNRMDSSYTYVRKEPCKMKVSSSLFDPIIPRLVVPAIAMASLSLHVQRNKIF